jgi:hypothetical protein
MLNSIHMESNRKSDLILESNVRRLFDTKEQQEMSTIFHDELRRYQIMFNETFGMHSQQQKQLCFLSEGLLGCALYFEVSKLQNILHALKIAACEEKASMLILDKLNREIDALLSLNLN